MNSFKKQLIRFFLRSRKRPFFQKKNKLFERVKKAPEYKVCSFGEKNKNKLFYVIKRFHGGGLFSNLLFVLNHLIHANKLGAVPIVDMENFTNLYSEKKKLMELIILGYTILIKFHHIHWLKFIIVKR